MRIMVTAGGGVNGLYPTVPLAWAFRAAGHDVRLVGKPQMAPALLDTGLPVVTLGRPPTPDAMANLLSSSFYDDDRVWREDWPAHPSLLEPWQRDVLDVLCRYSIAVSEAMADDVVAFARQWCPDLIIYETLSLSVAALPDVPIVRSTHGTQDVWRMEQSVNGEPQPEYVELLARFGVEPPTGLPHYVDTMPPSMYIGGERPCVSMRWVLYNGRGVAPDGLAEPRRRPRICVSWGVSNPRAFGMAAVNPFQDAIAAALEAGADVVVHAPTEQISALGQPSDRVRYLPDSPLNFILPFCDLHVHHGGYATSMNAACLGVPQLAITRDPMLAEYATRVAKVGCGIHFRYQDLVKVRDGKSIIRDAIDKLLGVNDYAEAATRLRADIDRQPPPADVVAPLIALATPLVSR